MRYAFLRFPNGKPKALTLSYDDGCNQDARFAQLVTKYGIKCTFNLNGDRFKNGNGLTTEQVEQLILANGHEVAVHGYFHRGEGYIRPIEGIVDVLECRKELERKYDRIIRGMAYPDCGITAWAPNTSYERVKSYLSDLDIAYSRTLGGDNDYFALPKDWHAWMPTAHHDNPKIMEYIEKFVSMDVDNSGYIATRSPKLFYLWGHSYEFDRNGGWEHAEEICKRLANKDDVWYATNIEIYDYVKAYNSLVYNAECTKIYNPALFSVWIYIDGKTYEIKSGETINI